jgi:hypothetical protein
MLSREGKHVIWDLTAVFVMRIEKLNLLHTFNGNHWRKTWHCVVVLQSEEFRGWANKLLRRFIELVLVQGVLTDLLWTSWRCWILNVRCIWYWISVGLVHLGVHRFYIISYQTIHSFRVHAS